MTAAVPDPSPATDADLDAATPAAPRGYCTAPGCEREAEAGGLCSGHRWRAKHGLKLGPLRERVSPLERVLEALYAMEDAAEEGGAPYHAAVCRLRSAARAWLGDDPRPRAARSRVRRGRAPSGRRLPRASSTRSRP